MGRISFQKRQKEMKRQEKQKMKAEKRAQRKLAKNAEATAQQINATTESESWVEGPADVGPVDPPQQGE